MLKTDSKNLIQIWFQYRYFTSTSNLLYFGGGGWGKLRKQQLEIREGNPTQIAVRSYRTLWTGSSGLLLGSRLRFRGPPSSGRRTHSINILKSFQSEQVTRNFLYISLLGVRERRHVSKENFREINQFSMRITGQSKMNISKDTLS